MTAREDARPTGPFAAQPSRLRVNGASRPVVPDGDGTSPELAGEDASVTIGRCSAEQARSTRNAELQRFCTWLPGGAMGVKGNFFPIGLSADFGSVPICSDISHYACLSFEPG